MRVNCSGRKSAEPGQSRQASSDGANLVWEASNKQVDVRNQSTFGAPGGRPGSNLRRGGALASAQAFRTRGARSRPVDRSNRVENALFCLLLSGFLFSTIAAEKLGVRLLWAGYGFAAGLALMVMARHGRGRLLWPPELRFLWVFAAWALTTGLFLTSDLGQYVQTIQRLVQIVLVVSVVACYCASVRSPIPALGAILLLGLLLVGYGILTGDFELASEVSRRGTRVSGHRAASLTSNANALGLACTWSLGTLAIVWGTKPARGVRFFLLFLIPPLLAGVVYSGSRKAVVLVFVFAAAYLWFCYRRFVLRRFGALVGALALLLIVGVFARYALRDTLVAQRFSLAAAGEDESAGMRILLYREALRVLVEHPLAGVGMGEFATVTEIGLYSHSEYLEIATSTGLIGAGLYFSLYVLLWRRLSRGRKASAEPGLGYLVGATQALFVVFMVGNLAMVVYNSFTAMVMFGGLLGFAYGADRPVLRTAARSLRSARTHRSQTVRPPFMRPPVQPQRGPSLV